MICKCTEIDFWEQVVVDKHDCLPSAIPVKAVSIDSQDEGNRVFCYLAGDQAIFSHALSRFTSRILLEPWR